jgi:glycogen debranching enzyme
MPHAISPKLIEQAKDVLLLNKKQAWTSPSPVYYRHQWLWDSAFIAIGLANYDPKRAAEELLSLKRGQWQNGMLPHVIFASRFHDLLKGPLFWQWRKSKLSSKGTITSAITQPPVLAIAAHKVAEHLKGSEKQAFLEQIVPMIEAYHNWLYQERDPDGIGLVTVIHPWETGLDNTPSWSKLLKKMPRPWWVRFLDKSGLFELAMHQRRGAKILEPDERTSNLEIIQASRLILRYRRYGYESQAIFNNDAVAAQSVSFNSILIKANSCLKQLAQTIGYNLPETLVANFAKTESALEHLWDEETAQYYSRDFTSKALIKTPAITTLLPLFSGSIDKQRADQLVNLIKNKEHYWTSYPLPTVPLDSPYFNPKRFWQGPVWVNTNWMIINGLIEYGYTAEAQEIIKKTESMIQKSGFCEYFSPLNGDGLGVKNFSWTAALLIDLANLDS